MRLVARIAVAVVAAGGSARADDVAAGGSARGDDDVATVLPDAPLVEDLSVREARSLLHDPGAPRLTLDVVPRPHIVGLGVTEDTRRAAISLGKRAAITLSGTSWKGYADAVPRGGAESDVARGTRTAIGFHYDLGWLQIDAELAQNGLSSRYGSGTYREVSLRISKSHRFSRWVTGWIGLSLGYRQWEGTPPPGEADAWNIMLSIGGTFR